MIQMIIRETRTTRGDAGLALTTPDVREYWARDSQRSLAKGRRRR